jgi:hypothetical protein
VGFCGVSSVTGITSGLINSTGRKYKIGTLNSSAHFKIFINEEDCFQNTKVHLQIRQQLCMQQNE